MKGLAATVLVLFITIVGVLQLPYVQNALCRKLLQHLSHTTQFTITHQTFRLKWLQQISLQGLVIKDPHDNDMLSVDQLTLKVALWPWLVKREINLPALGVKGARVHLRKEKEEEVYNFILLLQRLAGDTASPQDTSRPSPNLRVQSLLLQDWAVSINDLTEAPQQDTLDFHHLALHQIQAELTNLHLQNSTLDVAIQHLAGKHADAPLSIEHLATALRVTPHSVNCQALCLQTGHSHLRGDFTITDDDLGAAGPLQDKAHFVAHLDETVLSSKELGALIPYFKQHTTAYTLRGKLEGQLNDFYCRDFQLGLGTQDSHFKGHMHFQGLPDVQEATFDIALEHGILHTTDLRPYLDESSYQLIEPCKLLKAHGHFHGKKDGFTAQAHLDTDVGQVTTDLACKLDPITQCVTYEGAIAVCDLALGTLLHNDAIQQLTMQGQLQGQGLSLSTVRCHLEAEIAQLGLHNYVYKNIYTCGHFAHTFFQGKLSVDDPHLKLHADVTVDLSGDEEKVAVKGVLAQASLQELYLIDQDITLSTEVAMTAQGLPWNYPQTDTQLRQLCLGFEGKELLLDALHLRAGPGEAGQLLELDSDLIALKAEGACTYAALATDFQQFLQNYQRRWTHQPPIPLTSASSPYTFAYQIHCKDINPLLHIFMEGLYIAPHTHLQGSFTQGDVAALSLRLAEASALAFHQHQWTHIQLDLWASQSLDGQEASAQVHLASEKQHWGKLDTTEDLVLTLAWENQQLNFSGLLDEKGQKHHVDLQGQAILLKDTIEVVLLPSTIKLADQLWHIHPENRIVWGKSWTQFQNFVITSGEQQVGLTGTLSAHLDGALQLQIKHLALEHFHLFTARQLQGELNALVVFRGMLTQPQIDGDVRLQKLTIDQCLIGDIQAQTHWDDAIKQLNMTGEVNHLQKQAITIQGTYTPAKEENSLQLTAQLAHAPLTILEPLTEEIFSQLAGELSGTVYIHGSPASPRLTGEANITEAAVKINYLNTRYHLNGTLTCADQAIHVTALHLLDEQKGEAVLQGAITHQGLRNFQVNLVGSVNQLTLLDTTIEDNKYFYGTGLLSGDLTLSGPIDHMEASLKMKTEAGTSVYIPVGTSDDTVTKEGFIRFVRFNSMSQEEADTSPQVTLEGFKLTLELTITPDAYVELPLRTGTDDVIRGRGDGRITIALDTQGALSVAGNFVFSNGEYSLSLFQLVKKTFRVLPGSHITWYDRPQDGILDVQAAYEQRVTLKPLLNINTVPDTKRKYPVQVLVALQGALLSPDISYRVKFQEYPNDSNARIAVESFEGKVLEDQRYLTNQIVSLLIFKRFFKENLGDARGGLVRRSAEDFASQQLGDLVSSLDDNLELDADVDLKQLDRSGLEGLNFKLSYSFFDGRLRISREGGIDVRLDGNSNPTKLVGDWTVEYSLTEDGKLKAKLYNKSITSSTLEANNARAWAGGLSLLYTTGFNRWQELWRRKKKKTEKAD
ncbi:MAG: translocation/assembly module TamB domain-containing protein [Roseivirga sp.]